METTLGAIAEALSARLQGDAGSPVIRVATLAAAGPGDVTFLANRRYRSLLRETSATAVILDEEFASECPVAALVMDNPYLGFARCAALLNPRPADPRGIHGRAVVDPLASVDADAYVDAGAVVQRGAMVAARAIIGPGCVLGEDVTVGEDTRLGANVTLCRGVRLGARGIIHPGVVIGGDGFGIANDEGVWEKVPQLGGVRIGNDVEIGANTTIDRGALEDTVIEDGVKLDNLIQVGHNVHVGAHTAIAGCVAIGGSARIGKRCTIAGAASVAGHLELADDVHLTATSAVPNSISEPGIYSSGMPVQENRVWRRNVIRMLHIDEMARTLKSLQSRVEALERGEK